MTLEPAVPPPGRESTSRDKLVAHFKDGVVTRGYSHDFEPANEVFHIMESEEGITSSRRIHREQLKALFQVKTWGKFLFWALLGVLYIVAGFATFENPLLAAAILTLLLACALIASGIMRIILGFSMKQGMPWIWVVLSGVVTLLLGLIILAHWPVSSLYILGLLLGIDLVFAGASWIGMGLSLRKAA